MKQFVIFLGIVAMGATACKKKDTDIVHIPDVNFKITLLTKYNFDTNKDNEISYGEAKAYNDSIDVSKRGISDLTGIEAFVNITKLDCSDNKLTSLDVSKNVDLRKLFCDSNHLSSLDVSKNIYLQELSCYANLISSLDVSKNVALISLSCNNNRLISLDVSKNVELLALSCFYNQLKSLDISKNLELNWLFCNDNQLTQLNLANGTNQYIETIRAEGNPNLHCIQIDKGFTPPTSYGIIGGWGKDDHAKYSDNCNK